MWYAAHLASRGSAGDRARLARELDALTRLGVRNIRVLASSEGTDAVPSHVVPAIQPNPAEYTRDMMEGLDWLLKELSDRGMVAILILTNGMPWSGGMAQYVAWATQTSSPFSMMHTDWDAYYRYLGHFYKLEEAKALFGTFVRTILGRRNSFTGVMYRDDPTIMAWEIANQPRGSTIVPEYALWVQSVGKLIKSLDKNHMVGLGSDGTGGLIPFKTDYGVKEVDYTQVHMWPEKYKWHTPGEGHTGASNGIERARSFLEAHVRWSEQMGKPLVVGAFTLSRDLASRDPSMPTTQRDAFFAAVLGEADSLARAGRGLGGISFWGWSGEGRPPSDSPQNRLGWQAGNAFTGDPPSELQGSYSVYSTDTSTCEVIQKYAAAINSPAGSRP